MSLKNVMRLSLGLRIFIVVMGLGLVYFKCVKSENQAVALVIPPMLEAASSGNIDVIKKLLKEGQTPNIVDDAGGSVSSLVGPVPQYLMNVGNSALAFAVFNGTYPANQPCIDLMLQHQADPRLKNKEGQPPFFWVVKIDYKELRMETLGKLIKFGADINMKDDKSYTLLDKIIETYDLIGLDIFLDWWAKLLNPEVVHAAKERAIQYNLTDMLDVLNGTKQLATTSWGKLINPEVVSYDKGRSIDYDLGTSLSGAGKRKVFRPIMDAHWNPSAIDKRTGMNDLHYAVINDDKELVDACLERRVNINAASEDEFGMRPLHYAVLHYHPDMVKHLISQKADVSRTNLYLNTPLHMVAWIDNLDVAKQMIDILMSHGAQLNAKNKDGNTLLHMLVYNDKKDLFSYIGEKYGCNIDIKNDDRESVADIAKRLNRLSFLKNNKKNKGGN